MNRFDMNEYAGPSEYLALVCLLCKHYNEQITIMTFYQHISCCGINQFEWVVIMFGYHVYTGRHR